MLSILELREARERAVRWSVEDYVLYGEMLAENGVLPKRAELIRGIIIENVPKSALHVRLTKQIYDLFLVQAPSDCTVFQGGPLQLRDSVPEPDVMIVPGNEASFDDKHPTDALLVIKVAASSVAMDREYASTYAEANVQEYWIAVAETKQVEVYRLPVDGIYREMTVCQSGQVLICQSLLGVEMRLDELFA